jgi:hypothetical protein
MVVVAGESGWKRADRTTPPLSRTPQRAHTPSCRWPARAPRRQSAGTGAAPWAGG